jgi:PPOX class probable F420-dependent enzyme
MARMSPRQLDAFLRETRIAMFSTIGDDGAPTTVPVWFEWDGTVARIFTGRTAGKVSRIERDPRVCLTVAEGVGTPEAWVSIEGTAAVEQGSAAELAARLARRYYPPERAEAAIARWIAMGDRLAVVSIRPSRIKSMAPEA